MTPSQRAAAERLVEGPRTSSVLWGRAVIAILRELLAEPVINQQMTTELAEPVQEPVAWGVFVDDELFKPFNCKDEAVDWFQAQYNHGSRYDYLVLPLYAAPQQRTPLSDEVVAKLINDEWATSDVPSAWKFARAIERAITGEPT